MKRFFICLVLAVISNIYICIWASDVSEQNSVDSCLYESPDTCGLHWMNDTLEHEIEESFEPVQSSSVSQNTDIPPAPIWYYGIDTSSAVCNHELISGTNQFGAKTYDVPIKIPQGQNGHTPQIGLSYSSTNGNSKFGFGWELSGVPVISRISKNERIHSNVSGVSMKRDEAFALNGIPLIELSSQGDTVEYVTNQGHIRLKGYFNGDTLKYFDAFYPDGRYGQFGSVNNTVNLVEYPIYRLSDAYDNVITFSYFTYVNGQILDKISYNGNEIQFIYENHRPDHCLRFCGGVRILTLHRLKTIRIKTCDFTIGEYNLTYTEKENVSYLTEIKYSVPETGEYSAPLKFAYGSGRYTPLSAPSTFEQTGLNWQYGPNIESPNDYAFTLGRFYKGGNKDGLAYHQAKNPYFHVYQHGTLLRRRKNYVENLYSSTDEIHVVPTLTVEASPSQQTIYAGAGFVDLLCADLDGDGNEYLVKINNVVDGSSDKVSFSSYKYNPHTVWGYGMLNQPITNSFTTNTVHTDESGNECVNPKSFYKGDFDGNGRDEILSVSMDVFDNQGFQSNVCVYKPLSGSLEFTGHIFQYSVTLYGSIHTDPEYNSTNSDRIFILDYDGDGKDDICHISASGISVYTFVKGTTTLESRLLFHSSIINRNSLSGKETMLCDFNGDGMTDIIITPSDGNNDWLILMSNGLDGFESMYNYGPYYSPSLGQTAFIQDINLDGYSDIIMRNGISICVYLNDGLGISSTNPVTTYMNDSEAKLLPVDLNYSGRHSMLMFVKGRSATRLKYNNDFSIESKMTVATTGLGLAESIGYSSLDPTNDAFYSFSVGENFPYVNYVGPLQAVKAVSQYIGNNLIDCVSYSYEDAVIDTYGRTLCCFRKIREYKDSTHYATKYYLPERLGTLWKEETPTKISTYSYSYNFYNSVATLCLSSEIEHNLLTGVEHTNTYYNDDFGRPTLIEKSYASTVYEKDRFTYDHNPVTSQGYHIGFISQKKTEKYKGSELSTDIWNFTGLNRAGAPTVEKNIKNGVQISQKTYNRDSHGNITQISYKPYSSSSVHTTSMSYDELGRTISVTDSIGCTTAMTYDSLGQLVKVIDKRGNATLYSYDSFGRKITETHPDSTTTQISYRWGTASGETIEKRCTYTGKPFHYETYDAFGRIVKICDGSLDIYVKKTRKEYDSNGNLTRETLPYFSNQNPVWKEYTYDAYDRLTSVSDPSGSCVTIEYDGLTETTTTESVSVSRTYNELGQIVQVSDPSSSVVYTYNADGNTVKISQGLYLKTEISYDLAGRRTSMSDKSLGTITTTYNSSGNVLSETDARGNTTTFGYDSHNRIISKSVPEFTTTFSYNTYGELSSKTTSTGSYATYTYDIYGRIMSQKDASADNVWLQRDYTYADGNVKTAKYTSHRGVLTTLVYYYVGGYIDRVTSNAQNVYKINSRNAQDQPTKATVLNVERTYGYTATGLPTSRIAVYKTLERNDTIQNVSYEFDSETLNLLSRTDRIRQIEESFDYDNLNRLTAYGACDAEYDNKGNITSKSDIGQIRYSDMNHPYRHTSLTSNTQQMSTWPMTIIYTSFQRPDSISKYSYSAKFSYNGDFDREKMIYSDNTGIRLERWYIGGCYELDKVGNTYTEKLYLLDDYYSSPLVLRKAGLTAQHLGIVRDYLGSITHVHNGSGTVLQELSYDAWGRLRDPSSQVCYTEYLLPTPLLGRGYSGHEHLSQFGLFNMNARLYNPFISRMLSPDPEIQEPEFPQNFNRYAYALNNPFKYKDPNGKFLFLAFAAILNLGENIYHTFRGEKWNWNKLEYQYKLALGFFRGNLLQVLNKLTFSRHVNHLGYLISSIYNQIGLVDGVTESYGMLAISGPLSGNAAMTLGGYSIGPDNYKADYHDHLFVHEYGHFIQSQRMGPVFMPLVAWPSLFSAIQTSRWAGCKHLQRWFEIDASVLGANFFDKNEGPGSGSESPFDRDNFFTRGVNSSYINPRDEEYNKKGFYGSGAKFAGADLFLWLPL